MRAQVAQLAVRGAPEPHATIGLGHACDGVEGPEGRCGGLDGGRVWWHGAALTYRSVAGWWQQR